MTDKELKKEKEEVIDFLFKKIDSVKDNNKLQRILKATEPVKEYTDIYDNALEQFLGKIADSMNEKIKARIKRWLRDIFDKYDKCDRKGAPLYSDEAKRRIASMIREINKICDESLWDRFLRVLGIGL